MSNDPSLSAMTIEQARAALHRAIEENTGWVRGDSSYPTLLPTKAIDDLITAVRSSSASSAAEMTLAKKLEQVEAELLMAKQFLHEPGTDPEAWIDGAMTNLSEALAALRSSPAPGQTGEQ